MGISVCRECEVVTAAQRGRCVRREGQGIAIELGRVAADIGGLFDLRIQKGEAAIQGEGVRRLPAEISIQPIDTCGIKVRQGVRDDAGTIRQRKVYEDACLRGIIVLIEQRSVPDEAGRRRRLEAYLIGRDGFRIEQALIGEVRGIVLYLAIEAAGFVAVGNRA